MGWTEEDKKTLGDFLYRMANENIAPMLKGVEERLGKRMDAMQEDINDVKQELRKAGALNINYSATQKKLNE